MAKMTQVDFGLVDETQSMTKGFQMENLMDRPMILGLNCSDKSFDYEHQIVIPSESEKTVRRGEEATKRCLLDVTVLPLTTPTNQVNVTLLAHQGWEGNVNKRLELVSGMFDMQAVVLSAFIGQALFFPLATLCCFPLSLVGEHQQIVVPLINRSQYEIEFYLEPFGESDDARARTSFGGG